MPRSLVLGRRHVLRGLIGGAAVVIALPPLEAMLDHHGLAYAGGEPIPRRFGLWFFGNGVKRDRFIPSVTGTGWHDDPPPSLRPFSQLDVNGVTNVLPYVSVVSKTWVPFRFSWAHATSFKAMMTGSQPLDENGTPDYMTGEFPEGAEGPHMIDVITEALGGATKFPRIECGVSRGQGGADYLDGDVESSYWNPQALFDKLFADFVPNAAPPSEGAVNARKRVLDAVTEDAKALRARLGVADRVRLDEHLESIASLENAIDQVAAACTVPPDPGPRPADLAGNGEPLEEVNRAMSDLIAYAFACDLTRVVQMFFTRSQGYTHFWQVGANEGHHELGHDEPDSQPKIQATIEFTMTQLAYLAGKLASIPVGAGNLLDHSCIWASSEIADPKNHSFFDIPQLVIGRAGGALKGGVHHDAGGIDDFDQRLDVPEALHASLVLTMMRALGIDAPSFGVGDGRSEVTMPALEA